MIRTLLRLLTALALLPYLALPALAGPAIIPGPPSYVIQEFNYTGITTDATTTVKSGPGVLHTICINNPAATETVTLYDNTAASGTKIGSITLTATTQGCFTYDVVFSTGLTIVTATAAGDLTASWY